MVLARTFYTTTSARGADGLSSSSRPDHFFPLCFLRLSICFSFHARLPPGRGLQSHVATSKVRRRSSLCQAGLELDWTRAVQELSSQGCLPVPACLLVTVVYTTNRTYSRVRLSSYSARYTSRPGGNDRPGMSANLAAGSEPIAILPPWIYSALFPRFWNRVVARPGSQRNPVRRLRQDYTRHRPLRSSMQALEH